jgi:hypothetical protein
MATLTINDRRGVSGFAQGGIYRESIVYTCSEDIPASGIVRISPALFDALHVSKQVDNTDYFWYFVWTSTPGEYTATPNFPTKYKNIIIKVKVYTARIFEIKMEWLAIADTGKYLYAYPYQPLQLWLNPSVNKSPINVYNTSGMSLGIRVTIKNNPATDDGSHVEISQNDSAVQGESWTIINYPAIDGKYFMEVDGLPANGFVDGKDLTIKLRNFPRYTNSQYMAGIVRIDKLVGVGGQFDDELTMQYAKANNTADEPFELTSAIIDKTYLKDMHGFRYDQSESIAEFTIDKDYFDPSGQYRVFLITVEECQYKSYLFDVFGESSQWQSPSTQLLVTDVNIDGISLDLDYGNCLYNVPYWINYSATVIISRSDFETDLASKGISGNFDTYFKGAECFISDNAQSLGIEVSGQIINSVTNGDNQEITYSFKVPQTWAGLTKYVNIGYKFEYPNGIIDHLIGYISLVIADNADAIILKSPTGLPDPICSNDALDAEFCFESDEATSSHKFFYDLLKEGIQVEPDLYIDTSETNFSTDLDACLIYKFTQVRDNEELCLNMRSWNATADTDQAPCTDFVFSALRTTNGYEIEYEIQFDIPSWDDSDIKNIDAQVTDTLGNQFWIQAIGKTTGFIRILESEYVNSPWLVNVTIVRTDGATANFQFYFALGVNNTITVDTCGDTPSQNCEENPILSATVVYNYASPPSYAAITNKTITGVFTNPGTTPDSESKYKIINGVESAYTGAFSTGTYNSVALRWVITYPGCEPIELYHCIKEFQASIP